MKLHPAVEHEALCRRCGRCCVEKIEINGVTFSTTRRCEYLDPVTRLCRVYENRFDVNPRCLDVPRGIRHHVFPADCPYVSDLPGYRPPHPEPISDRVLEKLKSGEIQSLDELCAAMREHPAGARFSERTRTDTDRHGQERPQGTSRASQASNLRVPQPERRA